VQVRDKYICLGRECVCVCVCVHVCVCVCVRGKRVAKVKAGKVCCGIMVAVN